MHQGNRGVVQPAQPIRASIVGPAGLPGREASGVEQFTQLDESPLTLTAGLLPLRTFWEQVNLGLQVFPLGRDDRLNGVTDLHEDAWHLRSLQVCRVGPT